MEFQPDFRHVVDVARNRRPARLPVYEHVINGAFIAAATGRAMEGFKMSDAADRAEYFSRLCGFYRDQTYDCVSYEFGVTSILPGGGALLGERPGPIQTRADLEAYPWADLPRIFWEKAGPRMEAFRAALPPGMKGVGGIGNGVFEISQDLVGFERLCYMQADDPELFAELFRRIGGLLASLWGTFLERYADAFCLARIGDDMGFKTTTLLAPATLIEHVTPIYRRLIGLVHAAGLPFLLHSCGSIFPVMESLIDAGIDAKHSNEDVIAPFEKWIELYGGRIGLFGGIDVDLICQSDPGDVYRIVLERGARFRGLARGYALGSGNSIPEYVPLEGYRAMLRAANELRRREGV
ncbi:MAG: hypothetical protein BIFFINMI_01986 [Phycisphaerae bacterium]|nr:hypothetical protein [Phycisphaerae bacterium]